MHATIKYQNCLGKSLDYGRAIGIGQIQTAGNRGKFPGVLKKEHLEIRGVFKKKKNSGSFHGSWFLAFEIQKDITIFQNFQR